ncbi:hypothetical protein F2Q69_00020442 [Brassica cretica]|uniref:Uncharacterized protein n=1 Tax=Brassica cretica TaxID=69181 RepID=A0A8S9QAE7_BRACR|nr:hypothetical protein F2Q69_00020442 [Brassica cretica]
MSSEMGRSRERESLRCPRSRCVYGVRLSSRCVNGDKKETRDGSCVEMESASREAASIEIRVRRKTQRLAAATRRKYCVNQTNTLICRSRSRGRCDNQTNNTNVQRIT